MEDLKSKLDKTLKEDWEKLFKSLGVNSMDELLQKADKPSGKPTGKSGKGKKDYSKLVPVKRQITRGGRTVETTVYVSPKEAKEIQQGKTEKPSEKKEKKSIKDAKAGIISPKDSDKIKKLQSQLGKWPDKKTAQDLKEATKDNYLITVNINGRAVGVGAFKEENGALHLSNFGSSKEVAGSGKKVIEKLLQEANSRNLGVSINPPKGSNKLLEKLGFKEGQSGTYQLSAEGVNEVVEGKSKEVIEKPSESSEKPSNDTVTTKEKSEEEIALEKKRVEHRVVTKRLRVVRKKLGSNTYRDMLEFHDISWDKVEHQGVNTMRATMAAAEFIKNGGKLDVSAYLKYLDNSDNVSIVNELNPEPETNVLGLEKVSDAVIKSVPERIPRKTRDEFSNDIEYERYLDERRKNREERRRIREENNQAIEKMYEDYKNTANEFSSVEEAKEWFTNELLDDPTTFDDSIDPIILNHFKRIYDKVHEKFPMIKHGFNRFWTVEYESKWLRENKYQEKYDELIAEGKSESEAKDIADSIYPAEYKPSLNEGIVNASGGFTFGTSYGKDAKRTIGDVVSQIEDGWLAKGNGTMDNLIVHELGHIVDSYFKMHNENYDEGISKERDDFMREFIRKHREDIGTDVSGYAMTNDNELFAEAFSDYLLNPNASEMVKEFGEWVEKLSQKAQEEGLKFKGKPIELRKETLEALL